MNRDAWVSRGQAAAAADVSPDTIGKWRARGWVDQFGVWCQLRTKRLGNGRLLYRFGDILDAERDTFLSGKGHRAAA